MVWNDHREAKGGSGKPMSVKTDRFYFFGAAPDAVETYRKDPGEGSGSPPTDTTPL
jgi:hypothetical protein